MFVNNLYICIIKINKMARRGDIESKTISSRLPMETYIGLLQASSSSKKPVSVYVAELIANSIYRGGMPEPKIVEVEVIKEIQVSDPKQAEEIEKLKLDLKELETKIEQDYSISTLRAAVGSLVSVIDKEKFKEVSQDDKRRIVDALAMWKIDI
jgi:predicted DNA-binding protein